MDQSNQKIPHQKLIIWLRHELVRPKKWKVATHSQAKDDTRMEQLMGDDLDKDWESSLGDGVTGSQILLMTNPS
jgi:hypothetical protein